MMLDSRIKLGTQITVATVSGPKKATFEGKIDRNPDKVRVRWYPSGRLAYVEPRRILEWPKEPAPAPIGGRARTTAPRARPHADREEDTQPIQVQAVRAQLRAVPKPAGPTRSRGYLDHVRAQPCAGCRAPGPSDPHHWGPRGVGMKTDDHRTVPLCRRCHDTYHQTGSLPGMDPGTTRVLFLQRQVDLLVGWARKLESEDER
jgi:hypothetical protein